MATNNWTRASYHSSGHPRRRSRRSLLPGDNNGRISFRPVRMYGTSGKEVVSSSRTTSRAAKSGCRCCCCALLLLQQLTITMYYRRKQFKGSAMSNPNRPANIPVVVVGAGVGSNPIGIRVGLSVVVVGCGELSSNTTCGCGPSEGVTDAASSSSGDCGPLEGVRDDGVGTKKLSSSTTGNITPGGGTTTGLGCADPTVGGGTAMDGTLLLLLGTGVVGIDDVDVAGAGSSVENRASLTLTNGLSDKSSAAERPVRKAPDRTALCKSASIVRASGGAI